VALLYDFRTQTGLEKSEQRRQIHYVKIQNISWKKYISNTLFYH